MNAYDVKETMEQMHMPKKMKEEIWTGIRAQMAGGRKRAGERRKAAAAVAAVVLAVGVLALPVQAMVRNLVKARMERIPQEELQAVNDMVQSQDSEADGFSRAYSGEERSRMQKLRIAYEQGMFPEASIAQVNTPEEITEGVPCYVWSTGDFYLPERELTDEELLEIIDFQYETDYALSVSPQAEDARARFAAEQAMLKEQIRETGAISEEEAVEIARRHMKSELGAAAEGKDKTEVLLVDVSETDRGYAAQLMYVVSFENESEKSVYTCEIDASDGTVLAADELTL